MTLQALYTTTGHETLISALSVVLDSSNYPLLIHDDMGKATCSLICSLIRRLQGWSVTGIFAEGDMFAGPAGGAEGGGVGEAGREVRMTRSLPDGSRPAADSVDAVHSCF